MTTFRQFLAEELRDEEFAEGYNQVSAEMDFALALAMRREELGLTQQELAELTGIKQPMIARIEHGQMPTAPTMQRLAKSLSVKIVFDGEAVLVEPQVDVQALSESLEQGVQIQGAVVDMAQYRRNRKPYVGKLTGSKRGSDHATIAAAVG